MTPYHADDWLTVYHGDCREVMRQMEPESVHCVVTSPPYWGLRDYGVAGALGLEATPEEFVANMVDVFREVKRVLRSDGTCWVNLGDSYAGSSAMTTNEKALKGKQGTSHGTIGEARPVVVPDGLKPKDLVGIPWRVAFALQADGWYLRSDIIWAKPNPMPESVTDRPTKSHEYVFLLTKSPRYYYDADAVREAHDDKAGGPERFGRIGSEGGYVESERTMLGGVRSTAIAKPGQREYNPAGRNLRTVWSIATQPYPGAHFATFPEKLVEPCIKAGAPEKVCGECGAGWRRVTESEYEFTQAVHNRTKHQGEQTFGDRSATMGVPATKHVRTLGFIPSCKHDAETVPATVLDPFAGSGTVGMVAQSLSRRAVLIDLNGNYLVQAMSRNQQSPLGLETA